MDFGKNGYEKNVFRVIQLNVNFKFEKHLFKFKLSKYKNSFCHLSQLLAKILYST